MEILKALVLGLIQGICEFLPISSSGHLILAEKLLNIEGNILLLNIILHVATLLAICLVLKTELITIVKKPFSSYNKKLVVSVIPTIIIAVLMDIFLEGAFTGSFLAFGFLVTAALLIFDKLSTETVKNPDISYKTAIIMGIVQGFATLPGISRSGSTIAAGSLSGTEREKVTKFSFFMSVPVIIASTVYEIIFKSGVAGNFSFLFYAVSFLTAFISGIFALKLMIKVVANKRYFIFIIYLILIAILSFFL